MDRLTTLDALELESSCFLAAVSDDAASLNALVPSCPDWDVAQLVAHLGRIYSRTALIVSERRTEPPDGAELPVLPNQEALIVWFSRQRTTVVAALTESDDAAPVWNFVARRPEQASFWSRRMVHETLIHRVDAELAHGLVPAQSNPAVAADTLAEFFEIFYPRFEPKLIASGPPASLHIHATDVPGAEWTLELRPGASVITREHTKADAAIRGSAFELCCWAWRRLATERLEIFGDARIAKRFQEAARI